MDSKYNYTYEDDSEYCYPKTSILKNKINITNDEDLYKVELAVVAYETTNLLQNPITGIFDFKHLKTIHYQLFSKIYDWAGISRTCSIAKTDLFCLPQYIDNYANDIFEKLAIEKYYIEYNSEKTIDCLVALFADINALHPFREGNGRAQREFIEELAKINGINLDLTTVDKNNMIIASHESINGDYKKLTKLFKKCSKKINKEEQLKHIETYCTDKLKKQLLEFLNQ